MYTQQDMVVRNHHNDTMLEIERKPCTAFCQLYVLTYKYASHFINNEAENSKYALTIPVNEVLSLLMKGLYDAF